MAFNRVSGEICSSALSLTSPKRNKETVQLWRGNLPHLDGMKLAGSCHIGMLEKVSQYVLVEVTSVPLKTGTFAKTLKPIHHEEKKSYCIQ